MRVSILADMLDRAVAARPGRSGAEALVEAFGRGLAAVQSGPDSSGAESPSGESWARGRARLDVLRHRALLLTEQNATLARAVEALAEESLELHERLWAAHERSTRMKVVLGRRERATVRPEAPLQVGAGGGGRRRREAAERLLTGFERVELELPLGDEAIGLAGAVVGRLGWDEERFGDAPLVVLAYGLAVLEAESTPDATSAGPPAALEPLGYRVFELAESIRILAIRENAFRIDNHGMRLRLAQLEREIAELERDLGEHGGQEQRNGGARNERTWLARLWRKPASDPHG